ncbi:MAG: LCP family protein [Acidimicrobiia bacterium]
MNRKRILLVVVVAAVILVGAGAYFAASTWGDVQRVTIDRPGDSDPDNGAEDESDRGVDDGDPEITVPSSGDDNLDVALIVGSDSRENIDDPDGFGDFEGQRADVVMVLIRPRDDPDNAAIMSIPRDLWVDKVCDDGQQRVNEALEGCGSMNGPTVLVETVEALIGVQVDHFAMVDLEGFQGAVDAVGGYEICLARPVRDPLANLALPGGCTLADGDQTLAWLRSRHTQELTMDGWRTVEGASDLLRNERQREFMMSMMSRVADFGNPSEIIGIAQAVAPFVTVDSGLSLMDAVGLATTLRGLEEGSVIELEIEVVDHIADSGAAVLLAVSDPAELVSDFLSPTTAERGDSG